MTTVAIVGRLVKDPEVRTVGDYLAINMTIASSKKYKEKERTAFVPVVHWVKSGSKLVDYLKKGTQVAISGELETDSWKNEAGETRSKLFVRTNSLELIGGKSAPADTPAPSPAETPAPDPAPSPAETPEVNIDENEIPF